MEKAAVAASFVRTDIETSRDDKDTTLSVAGFVSWDPANLEWHVVGLRVEETSAPDRRGYLVRTEGGDFIFKREEVTAREQLQEEAQAKGVGRCVACVGKWGEPAMADDADWLCKRCRITEAKRRGAA